LWQCEAFAVDFFENNIAAATEKSFSDFFAEANRIVSLARFAEDLGSVGVGHESVEENAAILHFCKRSNRDLAAASEFVEEGALAGGAGAGGSVVKKG
jgi:hypothetical protein